MKKTFTTIMPDQIGAFLEADRCVSRLGLNISRVSYNKAVDVHMLFLEVEGDEEQLALADRELTALGYLNRPPQFGNVILIEFQLRDEPGALLPVLELIHQYRFNISYISSWENKSGYQYFKMGLFVENGREISEFMNKAAMLCPLRIIDYNKSEKVLDNTVFYLAFANDISEKMGFDEGHKAELIEQSNRVMQLLDERNSPPYKTFDYIGKFAEALRQYHGERFSARVSRYTLDCGYPVLLIEPPCGSNVCVIDCGDVLLFVDSGFACYEEELWALLTTQIPDFDRRRRELILTHADVDHAGCVDRFDLVHVNRNCLENFRRERDGMAAFREENPLHAPYVRISKILSGYRAPQTEAFLPVGGIPEEAAEPLRKIGNFACGVLNFELYEGMGGHVRGEMILLERTEKIAFTGDIFVNIKGFTKEQAQFNQLAPYLMTSVDTLPDEAKRERDAFRKLLDPGTWRIFSGHGAMLETEI